MDEAEAGLSAALPVRFASCHVLLPMQQQVHLGANRLRIAIA